MAQKLATLMVLLFAMAVGHSSATWCVCKQGLSETVLQKSIDYACGNGADCTLIHQGGGCYNPNTVLGHCNYAVNSYFQRKGQASGSCDFAGAAAISTTDPSSGTCVYPSSASTATSTNTPKSSSTTPGTTTPVGGGSPYMATPSNGVLGGVNSLGPSGVGMNTDDSAAGLPLEQTTARIFAAIVVLGNLFLWA